MYMGKKKENCYIKCTKCKKIFNNEIFDMSEYGYYIKEKSIKKFFCSYSCMMAYQHEKEKYDEPNKSVSVKGCRVYSPAGIQFS